MKNSLKPYNDYFHETSREFNASTRSLAQKRHHLSSSKVSDNNNKSKFQHRIEKVCPTNSLQAYKKQVALLKKQLQRLQKQLLKKDHRIFEMESSYTMYRQLQSQLEETYRIIYMYEGKIQQLEKELNRLQHKVADKVQTNFTAQEIQSLLSEYQEDNTGLRSTIEGQNRIIIELEERLKVIQSKYFQTSWKLSSQNRVLSNPLKKRFPKLRDTIIIQEISLSQRQKMINDLESKYNTLTAQKNKESSQAKTSRFSKQKMSVNKSQNQEIKSSRYSAWQTLTSPQLKSQRQSLTQNYTVEKIQNNPKFHVKQTNQDWEASRQGKWVTYETSKGTQNKKSQLTLSQNPSMSLNYSLSQGPSISQRSVSPQNGAATTYRLSSSNAGQSGTYVNSQSNNNFSISQGGYLVPQNNGGSQTRIISNSKVISNNPYPSIYKGKQTSTKINTYEISQSPQSPSSRIIRVSRQKQQPSNSQNKQSVTTYYQGSSSMAGNTNDSKNIRYVMRQAL